MNKWITGLPPYNKILSDRIYTFDELLNEYSIFFEDCRDDSEIEDPIIWETVTPNCIGDCDDNGVFYILLNKFVPVSFEEIYFFDFDKIAHLEEWSRFASNLRNAAEKEKISFEDYYDKIRK